MPLSGLYDLVVGNPLTAVCATLFGIIRASGWSPGGAVIVFAVAINALLAPVYAAMERHAAAGKRARADMDREVARVGRAFSGRERYFYVRAVHRQFGFHPLKSLQGAGELLLQVVIFAVVYRYLAGHEDLRGAAFLGIADLGRPDRLLMGASLLPIVMTGLNLSAAMLYDDDRRRRRESYTLALAFMVLLYRSPAGLVLYWTTNNAFSLLRILLRRPRNRIPIAAGPSESPAQG